MIGYSNQEASTVKFIQISVIIFKDPIKVSKMIELLSFFRLRIKYFLHA